MQRNKLVTNSARLSTNGSFQGQKPEQAVRCCNDMTYVVGSSILYDMTYVVGSSILDVKLHTELVDLVAEHSRTLT